MARWCFGGCDIALVPTLTTRHAQRPIGDVPGGALCVSRPAVAGARRCCGSLALGLARLGGRHAAVAGHAGRRPVLVGLGAATGQLHWDALASGLQSTEAGVWFWLDSAGLAPQPVLGVEQALDLQQVMLLRLRSAGLVPRWVWVQQHSDPARWLDLRRALLRASA
jgi:hypothetical protein